MKGLGSALIVVLAALGSLSAADPREVVIEVQAGNHERKATPVVFPLPKGFHVDGQLAIEPLGDGPTVETQPLPGDRSRLVGIVRDLPAGSSRRYRLKPSTEKAGVQAVTCREDGGGLLLQVGDRPVLRYHVAVAEAPSGLDPVYRKSGHIHPLYTPSRLVVSDDFPPDHAHQHGLFFAWVNTTFGGHQVDFWNQREGTGKVEHATVLDMVSGPVFAQFRVQLLHQDLAGPTAVLDDVWTVRAYNLSDRFLVDFESRQSCAGPRPLEINKYHYGGMGLRGSRAWFDPKARGDSPPDPSRSGRSDFLTSEEKGRADGNHTRPRWVDLSGLLEGRAGGVALLDHPDNFRFPQPVRLHPNKPYFCFAPMVLSSFTIEPGRPYVSRYRLDLHDGPPDAREIDRLWRDYAEPPRVRVVSE
jgi:hypothetical protein